MRNTITSLASNERLSSDRRVLLWDLEAPETNEDWANIRRNPAGALDHFVRMLTPEDALGFVKKYGPAGLCHHGVPAAHNQGIEVDLAERWANIQPAPRCYPMVIKSGSNAEHSGWYLDVAKTFKQVLDAESKIRDWEQSGYSAREWLPARSSIEFLSPGTFIRPPDWEMPTSGRPDIMAVVLRQGLVVEVNTWFIAAGINPNIEFDYGQKGGKRRLQMNSTLFPGNAFSAVVIQLAHVVSGEAQLATCSKCGNPYAPRRTPKRGQRNWCGSPECTREKNRINQQTARRRKAGMS